MLSPRLWSQTRKPLMSRHLISGFSLCEFGLLGHGPRLRYRWPFRRTQFSQTFRHDLLHYGYIEMFQSRLPPALPQLTPPLGSLEGFFQHRGDLFRGIICANHEGAAAMLNIPGV